MWRLWLLWWWWRWRWIGRTVTVVLETKGCQIRSMQCAMGKRDSSGSAAVAAAAAVVDGGKIVEVGKHKKEKKEKKRSREDTPDDGCDDLGDLGAFAEKVIARLRVPVANECQLFRRLFNACAAGACARDLERAEVRQTSRRR